MGPTLSKLWVSFTSALFSKKTGSGSAATNTASNNTSSNIIDNNAAPAHANGIHKDTTAAIEQPGNKMAQVKKYEIKEPWLKLSCSLGEAPFYEESTNTLRFLDVEQRKIHSVSLDSPSTHKVVAQTEHSMGCTADIEGNTTDFIFGGKYGYGICNRSTGEYRWIKKVWSESEVAAGKPDKFRGNDGAVDSAGRFWMGFMFDPLVTDMNSEGAVFRLHPDGTLDRPLDGITIPNGTTWNKHDNLMYFADSPFKTIYQFDYDAATGAVSNKRPFFVMPDDNRYGADAVPDGHCIDEEGYMWTALHGGSHVLRISPEGEIVAEIKVPTQQPTCPCFCGEDLLITSAGGTSGEGGKGVDEFAGSVFRIHVGVRGLKRFKFKGGVAVEGGKVDGDVVGE